MFDNNGEKTTNNNFPDISKPLCLLINKTSRGIEWLANALAPESAGVNAYIEFIRNGNCPKEIKAVLIANARKTIREARNQANILKMTSKIVNSTTDTSHVSLGWMDEFMDQAKNISDEELQILWAKILKSEIERSDDVSIRVLDVLHGLNKDEAKLFEEILQYVFRDGQFIYHGGKILEQYGVLYANLIKLEECGLLRISETVSLTIKGKEALLFDADKCIMHAISQKSEVELNLPIYSLTEVGKVLFRIMEVKQNVEYYWDVLEDIKKQYPTWDIGYCKVLERAPHGIGYDRNEHLTKEEFLKLFED